MQNNCVQTCFGTHLCSHLKMRQHYLHVTQFADCFGIVWIPYHARLCIVFLYIQEVQANPSIG